MAQWTKRSACALLFWSKVFLAVLLALVAIGLQSFLIYDKRQTALANPWIPPPAPPVISFPGGFNAQNASTCSYTPGPRARLEPPPGVFLWGFDLQWNVEVPSEVVSRLNNRRPPIFNSFINMNQTDFQRDTIVWNAQECQKVGAMLEITLMPTVDVELISADQLFKFALLMRHVNSMYGTPVLLRFMHEMNGNWLLHYGMRPVQFKQAFVTMSSYVHQLTNMTAMVWSPNSGNGYPYDNDGFDYHNPKANDTGLRAANFAQLNTDNVGASADLLTNTDDPYGPYWPGDQWVDWVGLSVYNIYRDPTTRQTAPAPVDVFTNPQSASSIVGIDPIHQFYRRFVVEKNKPFIFSETGASYTKDLPGASTITPDANPEASELAVKQSWWRAILNTAASNGYENWKAAVWFEEVKEEQSYDFADVNITRDYHITHDAWIREPFVKDVDEAGSHIKWANDFEYTCSGEVNLKTGVPAVGP